MPDKTPSPFAGLGLDKALLRSTQRPEEPSRQEPVDEGQVAPPTTRRRRHTDDSVTRSDERPNERPNVRTKERLRIRHSFDIYQDQLLSLAEIQAALFKKTGRKPKVGELVQDALDAYIRGTTGRSDR